MCSKHSFNPSNIHGFSRQCSECRLWSQSVWCRFLTLTLAGDRTLGKAFSFSLPQFPNLNKEDMIKGSYHIWWWGLNHSTFDCLLVHYFTHFTYSQIALRRWLAHRTLNCVLGMMISVWLTLVSTAWVFEALGSDTAVEGLGSRVHSQKVSNLHSKVRQAWRSLSNSSTYTKGKCFSCIHIGLMTNASKNLKFGTLRHQSQCNQCKNKSLMIFLGMRSCICIANPRNCPLWMVF